MLPKTLLPRDIAAKGGVDFRCNSTVSNIGADGALTLGPCTPNLTGGPISDAKGQ